MLFDYLARGVTAGVAAGLVFGLFLAVVANPLVGYADTVAHGGHEHAEAAHGDQDAAVSPVVNSSVSVLSGVLWAVLLGGVTFGIAFYLLEPAIPGQGATKSYLLGLAGFVTASGAPWLVLPPATPGAEQSLPVATRLALYGGMMVAGAAVCLLSGYIYNRLFVARSRPVAALAALAPLGLLAIPATLAPTNTLDSALSPGLQAGLMGLVVFGQGLLWLSLAVAHARLQSSTGRLSRLRESDSGSAVGAD